MAWMGRQGDPHPLPNGGIFVDYLVLGLLHNLADFLRLVGRPGVERLDGLLGCASAAAALVWIWACRAGGKPLLSTSVGCTLLSLAKWAWMAGSTMLSWPSTTCSP